MFQRNAKPPGNTVDTLYRYSGAGTLPYMLRLRKQLSNGIYAKIDITILTHDTISLNFLYYSKSDDTKNDLDFTFTGRVDKGIARYSMLRSSISDCRSGHGEMTPATIEQLMKFILQCESVIDFNENTPTQDWKAISYEIFLKDIYKQIIKLRNMGELPELFSNLTSAVKDHENDLMNQLYAVNHPSGPLDKSLT